MFIHSCTYMYILSLTYTHIHIYRQNKIAEMERR